MSVTRLARIDDAEELAAVLAANREFLAPWEPLRDDSFFTVAEREHLSRALEAHRRGAMAPLVIVDEGGRLVGRITAETLLHNTGSQRVLERNGFKPYGVAPTYLKIAGRWQDCVLFHLFNPSPDE